VSECSTSRSPRRLEGAVQKRLLTMLDPLVFRAADAFLRWAPPTDDEPLREAISQNVNAPGCIRRCGDAPGSAADLRLLLRTVLDDELIVVAVADSFLRQDHLR